MTDPALPHRSAEDEPRDDRPSIAELDRLRTEMTSGPFRYDYQGWIESMDRGINHTGAETEVLVLGARGAHADGEGTTELLNAAPALLEIAAAALLEHGPCDHPEGRCGNGSHFRGCPRFEGQQRVRDALAKVRR